MSYAISPITEAGEHVIGAAESLIEAFWPRSDAADRTNEIDLENYRDMQHVGITVAFVSKELGGFGLQSINDWTLTIAALARRMARLRLPSVCTRGLAALYHLSEPGSAPHTRAEQVLEVVARKEVLICSTTTERGTDNLHSLTEATACEEGWRLNGTKNFVTMSPLATHVATNVRMQNDEGDYIANVLMPMDTEGVVQSVRLVRQLFNSARRASNDYVVKRLEHLHAGETNAGERTLGRRFPQYYRNGDGACG